jgi:hypothetical protein
VDGSAGLAGGGGGGGGEGAGFSGGGGTGEAGWEAIFGMGTCVPSPVMSPPGMTRVRFWEVTMPLTRASSPCSLTGLASNPSTPCLQMLVRNGVLFDSVTAIKGVAGFGLALGSLSQRKNSTPPGSPS